MSTRQRLLFFNLEWKRRKEEIMRFRKNNIIEWCYWVERFAFLKDNCRLRWNEWRSPVISFFELCLSKQLEPCTSTVHLGYRDLACVLPQWYLLGRTARRNGWNERVKRDQKSRIPCGHSQDYFFTKFTQNNEDIDTNYILHSFLSFLTEKLTWISSRN